MPTRVRVALVLSFPSLAPSVALIEAVSMSLAVLCEMTGKKAVPSVRHKDCGLRGHGSLAYLARLKCLPPLQ